MTMRSAAAGRFRESPSWLPLAACLLPVATVNLCYALSVQASLVPGCIPYLSGCTSISAAGRYGVAYYLFKIGMLPSAALLAAYWIATRRWLRGLGADDTHAVRAMVALGVTSAAFLVLYTVFLGSKGEFYGLMRRYGVTVYFSFGALAQMLLVRTLSGMHAVPARILRGKLVVVSLLLAAGLASLPVGLLAADKDKAENVIEWIFAAVMSGFYLLSWRAWKATARGAKRGG